MKPLRSAGFDYFLLINIFFFLYACEAPSNIEKIPAETVIQERDHTYTNTSFLLPPTQIALKAKESFTLHFSGQAIGAPQKADVVIMMDLTGSMRDALFRLQTEAEEVISGIQNIIPEARFGLVSHHDYFGEFSGCGTTWNNKIGPDNPYSLNVPVTEDTNAFIDKLYQLEIGYGGDPAESYSRVLSELVNDQSLQWDETGRKIVIAFLDDLPHDCNVYSLIGKEKNTGPDPGRDHIAGTEDDLKFVETLENLKAYDIFLFPIFNGTNGDNFEVWNKASQITGGNAYQVHPDGSPLEEGKLSDLIKDIVRKHTNHIQNVSINACNPEYENWIVEVNPENVEYTPANNSIIQNYEVTLKVPEGTPSGIYSIDLCLTGDGAEYARTEVKIIVPEF